MYKRIYEECKCTYATPAVNYTIYKSNVYSAMMEHSWEGIMSSIARYWVDESERPGHRTIPMEVWYKPARKWDGRQMSDQWINWPIAYIDVVLTKLFSDKLVKCIRGGVVRVEKKHN